MMVSIDGQTPYTTSYSDPNPSSYRQWYQTPQLSEGSHNISLSNIAGTSLDFAVVKVGKNTPLAGQTVIVDNDDPGFRYDNKWQRNQAQFNSGPYPDGLPFGNTTHQTTYVGSSFTYRFSGKSLLSFFKTTSQVSYLPGNTASIYGIFTWSNIGALTLSFTLDNATVSRSYRVNADTPQFKQELEQQQNFNFYSYDFLTTGDHTLVVNVTECVNQTFAFDYITYTPSFATLADMPNLPLPSSTQKIESPSSKKTSKTAIIGGIAGAVIILLLLLGLVFIFRRKRRSSPTSTKQSTKYTPRESINQMNILYPLTS